MAVGLVLGVATATVIFKETFDSTWEERWHHTKASGRDGKFVRASGEFFGNEEAAHGIKTSQDAKFYGISTTLDKPFSNEGKDLVLQFSVKHEQNIDCGGGYIKVLPKTDPAKFEGESPYYIMFGPDICGYTKKIHLIFGYKGKNLLWKKEPRCESDQLTHVYTLIVHPDNTYEVQVDGEKRESGKMEEDWDFLKPRTIPDAEDKKPSDWVDEAEMEDPSDHKPADWDTEPENVADPDASKPDDWNEEEDGAWEAPMIPNPKHKGAWKAKRIPNPAYKGAWAPKQIPNPEFEEDAQLYVFPDIQTLGFDLWQVKSGTIFDDILLADSVADATAFRAETFDKNKDAEKTAKEAVDKKAADAAKAAAPPAAGGGDDEEGEDEEETL